MLTEELLQTIMAANALVAFCCSLFAHVHCTTEEVLSDLLALGGPGDCSSAFLWSSLVVSSWAFSLWLYFKWLRMFVVLRSLTL